MVCGILGLQPGMKPTWAAVKVWCLNPSTTSKSSGRTLKLRVCSAENLVVHGDSFCLSFATGFTASALTPDSALAILLPTLRAAAPKIAAWVTEASGIVVKGQDACCGGASAWFPGTWGREPWPAGPHHCLLDPGGELSSLRNLKPELVEMLMFRMALPWHCIRTSGSLICTPSKVLYFFFFYTVFYFSFLKEGSQSFMFQVWENKHGLILFNSYCDLGKPLACLLYLQTKDTRAEKSLPWVPGKFQVCFSLRAFAVPIALSWTLSLAWGFY